MAHVSIICVNRNCPFQKQCSRHITVKKPDSQWPAYSHFSVGKELKNKYDCKEYIGP